MLRNRRIVLRHKAWSPLHIAGAVIWLDLSDAGTLYTDDMTTNVTSDADLIYAVADKSGNGNHFKQTDSSKRHNYKVNIKNGRSASYADKDNMRCINNKTFYQHTIILCGSNLVDNNPRHIFGVNKTQCFFSNTQLIFGEYEDVNEKLQLPLTSYTPYIASGIISNSGYLRLSVSGKCNEIFGDSWNNSTTPASVDMGGYNNAYNWNIGHYYEVVVYDRPLSFLEILLVEEYLNNKWAIY